jgi:hypothetical protein
MIECRRELLAECRAIQVESCACGMVHVTIGAVTMRFAPEAAAELSATLGEAMQRWAITHLGARRQNARPS